MKNPAGIKAFGAHVRALRQARGWSQQVLADEAEIAKPTVQRIEHAQFAVTLDVLISLARALNLSLSELLAFAEPSEQDH